MISYRHDGSSPFKITVKLEGKVVGHIKRDTEGRYFYKPKSGLGGISFDTVDEVKASLEAV